MPQIINTNIASLNAQRNLDKSQNEQSVALQRLSSGLRINGAKDDAAGLAISNRIDAQVRGLNVANRNAGDGVSLAQTAEGALNSMTTSLQRMRELALQSANGTNTSLERSSLQEEVEQLKTEIASIAEKTNFNGQNLLDGSFQGTSFQTGANVGDRIDVSISEVSEETLGTDITSGLSSVSSTDARPAMAAGDLVINGFAVGAADAGADGASTADQNLSSIAIAASINAVADQSGVSATVNATVASGTEVTNVASAANFDINGVTINVGGSGDASTLSTDLQGVADAINLSSGQTGVTASVDLNNLQQGVTLSAADGRNIDISGAGAAAAGVAAADTYVGSYTLVSKDGSDIEITSNTGASLENAGLEVGSYSGSKATAVSDTLGGTALTAGDLVINGTAVGATFSSFDNASTANKDASAISVASAINLVSDQTGVTATANTTQVTSSDVSADTAGNATVNGVSISFAAGTTGTTSEQVSLAVDAINAKTAQTGVTAKIVDDNQYELLAEDGRNIVVGSGTNFGAADATTFGTVKLESGGPIEISTQDPTAISNSGFEVGTYGGSQDGQQLKDIDISTAAGAEDAITAIDNAINQVAREQAKLGAIQNRFENTISNNAVNSENLSAANSRIRDADFATETAALSRAQVLQQAGISVLSQANARPQQVLSLLQ
ncbi:MULTISPECIES: flagellin [unclassified Oleiphilus]|uniref:flagellin N-terminal helical domain-containing protein n=2 Tax=Oleiphilus TaxID=141450 RepID=UPI0007C27C2F|nr:MULTISPECIES: flagellin [unclassified Oleiphilus]KZY45411.1 flagellin [Oleiphilus sp. HI0050]KZZ31573.1 flagellin [Oleiphilus sp. HI0086]KZZ53401.1 flagellin [Oleiphilus sp. HI0123]